MSDPAPASAAPSGASTPLPPWGQALVGPSGPEVARSFARAFALVQLAAWLSLAYQLPVLLGPRGLLPANEFFDNARAVGSGFLEQPTLFWLGHSQAALTLGAAAGVVAAVLAFARVVPRACFAAGALLYLSFATVGDDFTAFQWDSMLVEMSLLAAFLPLDRPAPLVHFAFRALLFKLYFESGIAKWQSHLGDWQDGSAMTFYYETAPIPAWLAFHAHHLPEAFHHFESRAALALELVVPLFIWGPRPLRLFAFGSLTGFQLINTATANYGFFTYLSLTLHLFLLEDRDVVRARALISSWLGRSGRVRPGEIAAMAHRPTAPRDAPRDAARRWAARTLLALWLAASLVGGVVHFSHSRAARDALASVYSLYTPFRVANVYHLFGHITRERIEPQFEVLVDGDWRELSLRWKPGPLDRAPPYVAPHQPRLDFRLWFYGLSFRRGMPRYVDHLLDRLCHDAPAVQVLFAVPLPTHPMAVRIAFYRYHFASPELHRERGVYWTRETLGRLAPRACDRGPNR